MTTAHEVRGALVCSQRWTDLLAGIPILTLAAHPPIEPEDWTEAERAHVMAWARGARTKTPAVITAWIAAVRS